MTSDDSPDVNDNALPDWLLGPSEDQPVAVVAPLLVGLPEFDASSFCLPETPAVIVPVALVPAAPVVKPPAPQQTLPSAPASVAAGWQVVVLQVPHDAADPADTRTFRFEVMNETDDAREFQVAFALPRGMKSGRATQSPKRTVNGLEWNLGVVDPGAVTTIAVRIPLEAATEHFRSTPAEVRIAMGPAAMRLQVPVSLPKQPAAAPVNTPVEVPVVPVVAVELRLPEAVGTDEEVTGRLRIENAARVALSGFRVSLSLPEQLVFRGATERGHTSERGDLVLWEPRELAADAVWEATFQLVGFTPGRLRLVATVVADGLAETTATAPLGCEVRRSAGGSTLAELLAGLSTDAFHTEPESEAPAPVDTRVRHLLFRAGGTRLAIPIANVREVLRSLPVTPVPGAPEWLTGVSNVRGDIVTIVDAIPYLGLTGSGTGRDMVIVRADGQDPIGLLIDEVAGIRPLAINDVAVPADEQLGRFLAGIAFDAYGLIHQLDPLELLAAAEIGTAAY